MKVKKFGDRLKEILDEKKISPYRLSKETGISQPTIGRYLNGGRLPDGQTLIKLINYLNIDSNWLLTGSSETSKITFSEFLTPDEIDYLNKIGKDKIVAHIISNKQEYLANDEFKTFLELMFVEEGSKVLSDAIIRLVKERRMFF